MAASILVAARARVSRLVPNKVKMTIEKLKGGRLEKFALYLRGVMMDYREVTKDAVKDARGRPVKTAVIFTGLGTLVAAFNSNPGERALTQQLLTNSNRLLLVPDSIRNRASEEHYLRLHRANIEGVLRITSLVFFSLMWVSDHDVNSGQYAAQCSYLKPRYSTFFRRVVDVGAFGRWFVLERRMRDYDVNNEEWTIGTPPANH